MGKSNWHSPPPPPPGAEGLAESIMVPIGSVKRFGQDVSLLLDDNLVPSVARLFVVSGRRTVVLSSFFAQDNNGSTLHHEHSFQLLINMYSSLQDLGLDRNLICTCSAFEHCLDGWARKIPLFAMSHTLKHVAHQNLKGSVWHVTQVKWLMATQFLRHSYDVLWLDFDLGIAKPFWHIIDNIRHDLLILSDVLGNIYSHEKLPTHQRFHCPLNYTGPYPNACASTGVWHAVASPLTAELTHAVYNVSVGPPFRNEQRVFNILLLDYLVPLPSGPKKRLHVELFPIPEIVNGRLLRDLPAERVDPNRILIFHCGYFHGIQTKIDALQKGYAGLSFWKEHYAGEDVRMEDQMVLVGADGML